MSGLSILDQGTKKMLSAMKNELFARVGNVAKYFVLQNECSCYGCEGCGYNCGGGPDPKWGRIEHARTLALG